MLHAPLQLRLALVSLAVPLLAAAARAQVVVPLDAIERETAARVAAGATSVAWTCAPAPDGSIGCSAEEDASAVRFGDGRPGARLPARASVVLELAEIGRALTADPGSREVLARWSALVEGELRAGRDPTRLIPRILEDAQLESVGDDAQLANVDLQNTLQKQQQTLQTLSNISKALHDTAMAVIRKMGG